MRYRSKFELELAKVLMRHKVKFQYESKKFLYIPKPRTYTPDFYIPSLKTFIEIKGHGTPTEEAMEKMKATNDAAAALKRTRKRIRW